MNKRTTPSTPTSPSSRIKLSLRRATLRELSHADLTSVAAGSWSRVGDDEGCAEVMDPR
jgi:hypothetical protein